MYCMAENFLGMGYGTQSWQPVEVNGTKLTHGLTSMCKKQVLAITIFTVTTVYELLQMVKLKKSSQWPVMEMRKGTSWFKIHNCHYTKRQIGAIRGDQKLETPTYCGLWLLHFPFVCIMTKGFKWLYNCYLFRNVVNITLHIATLFEMVVVVRWTTTFPRHTTKLQVHPCHVQ